MTRRQGKGPRAMRAGPNGCDVAPTRVLAYLRRMGGAQPVVWSAGWREGRSPAMSEHVHVRINQGLGVAENGELVEHFSCRCGATWTKTYRVGEEDSA